MSILTVLTTLALVLVSATFLRAQLLMLAQRPRESPRPGAAQREATRARLATSLVAARLGAGLAALGLGALVATAWTEPLAGWLVDAQGWTRWSADPVAVAAGLLGAIGVLLVVARLVGRRLPDSTDRGANGVVWAPVDWWSKAVAPLVWVVDRIVDGALVRLGRAPQSGGAREASTERLLRELAESRRRGAVDEEQLALVARALGFVGLTAGEVARPLDALPSASRVVSARRLAELLAGGDRLLIHAGDPARPLGFVHVKDLWAVAEPDRPLPYRLLRQLLQVGPEVRLTDLLLRMRQARTHLAVVVGEGGIEGVVSLDDVLARLDRDVGGPPDGVVHEA